MAEATLRLWSVLQFQATLSADSQSAILTGIHLPIALWLVAGLAYVADDWRSSRRRMDFIRFTGEWL